jgi:hypothetical protein
MKKLILSVLLFSILTGCGQSNEAVKEEQTVTYTYTINSIENGIYDGSATDGTGVIFDSTVIPAGTEIQLGDKVEIVFPEDDHETFLSFEKLN